MRWLGDLNTGSDIAKLEYIHMNKRTVNLTHTYVPVAYRGRGVANNLAIVSSVFPYY